MKWRDVLLLALLAAMCFGGTFDCSYHSGGDYDYYHPHPPPTAPVSR